MSLLKEIRGALSFKRGKDASKYQLTSEKERRILLVAAAIIIFVVAIATLLVRTANSAFTLASCKSIILSRQRYSCFSFLANKTNNYSICSYLSTQADSYYCIATIAVNQQNLSGCGKINASNFAYDGCVQNVSYIKNNVNYCLTLKGDNESVCAYAIAKENGFSSISYCNLITNNSKRSLCNSIYYYNAALSQTIPSYCSLLPSVTNSTLLYIIVSKDFTNKSVANFSYLSFSELNITPKSYCYYNIARSTKNSAFCSYASGVMLDACYASFNTTNTTQITNLSSVCATVPSYAKDLCNFGLFSEQALIGRNVSSCIAISNLTYRNTCIVQLAAKYNDSSYCSYINNNDSAQQACLISATATTGK